jgi:hypothetical protein
MSGFHVPRTVGWTVYHKSPDLLSDVGNAGSVGPYARGRKKVEETLASAAANYREGDATHIELVAKYLSRIALLSWRLSGDGPRSGARTTWSQWVCE